MDSDLESDDDFDPFERGSSALMGSDNEDFHINLKAKSVSWSYAKYMNVSVNNRSYVKCIWVIRAIGHKTCFEDISLRIIH